jgi:hypothetical protein
LLLASEVADQWGITGLNWTLPTSLQQSAFDKWLCFDQVAERVVVIKQAREIVCLKVDVSAGGSTYFRC